MNGKPQNKLHNKKATKAAKKIHKQPARHIASLPKARAQKSLITQSVAPLCPLFTATVPSPVPVASPFTMQMNTIVTSPFQKLLAAKNASPFTMAKRTVIHKPKAPLDNEVDLRFDFNILKDAQPISEQPDDQYPEWLWNVSATQLSLYDISKIPEDEMDIPTMRRKFKLERRDLIKGNNATTRK